MRRGIRAHPSPFITTSLPSGKTELCDQELDHCAVKLLGNFFVGKMAHAGDDQEFAIAQMARKNWGRVGEYGRVSGTPDEQNGNIKSWDGTFQVVEVSVPRA
jgi:hypothetical protein